MVLLQVLLGPSRQPHRSFLPVTARPNDLQSTPTLWRCNISDLANHKSMKPEPAKVSSATSFCAIGWHFWPSFFNRAITCAHNDMRSGWSGHLWLGDSGPACGLDKPVLQFRKSVLSPIRLGKKLVDAALQIGGLKGNPEFWSFFLDLKKVKSEKKHFFFLIFCI